MTVCQKTGMTKNIRVFMDEENFIIIRICDCYIKENLNKLKKLNITMEDLNLDYCDSEEDDE